IKRAPAHPMFPKLRDGMTILDFMRDPSFDDNRQTRQLARYPITDALTSAHYWWTAIPTGLTAREHLGQAQETLETCEFVGFFEKLELDVATLSHRFKLPKRLKLPRAQETIGRPSLDELDRGVVEEIRERNILDIELYEHARALYGKEERGRLSSSFA